MVNSYGQLLLRRHRQALQPEARDFVDFMMEGGQRALALIRDLLSLARIDSPTEAWGPVPLDEVLRHSLQDLRHLIDHSGAQVSHDPLPVVLGDRVQLGQLMGNLLSNALKFRGSAAPRVHIAARPVESGWCLEVSDNGIGIDPRFFDRIFMLFQRLHPRAQHDGTGIGLAVCKRVVERHGGQIGVRSTPGAGSTFHFTLPGAPGTVAQAATPGSKP